MSLLSFHRSVKRYLSVDAVATLMFSVMTMMLPIAPLLWILLSAPSWDWPRDIYIALGFMTSQLAVLLVMGAFYHWKAKRGRALLEQGRIICARVVQVVHGSPVMFLRFAFTGFDGKEKTHRIVVMTHGPLGGTQIGDILVLPTRRIFLLFAQPAQAYVDDVSRYVAECSEPDTSESS